MFNRLEVYSAKTTHSPLSVGRALGQSAHPLLWFSADQSARRMRWRRVFYFMNPRGATMLITQMIIFSESRKDKLSSDARQPREQFRIRKEISQFITIRENFVSSPLKPMACLVANERAVFPLCYDISSIFIRPRTPRVGRNKERGQRVAKFLLAAQAGRL